MEVIFSIRQSHAELEVAVLPAEALLYMPPVGECGGREDQICAADKSALHSNPSSSSGHRVAVLRPSILLFTWQQQHT